MDWDYLSSCLQHYGLDLKFISWTKKFLSSSFLSVIGNSFKTNPIFPQRGLRQGDPMSPILYNFAINPLLCHLEKLHGVLVKGQPPLQVLAFADDCVLGIHDHNDTSISEEIIARYEKASQAKLNSHKSVALKQLSPPSILPFNISYTDVPVKHLGILVNSEGTVSNEIESQLLEKIQQRIAQWKYFQPSLKGRVLLFNTFVSSKLWYFVCNFPISKNFCAQIKPLMNNWIWQKRIPPFPTQQLCIKTRLGGLSLLDPILHSKKMFSFWLSSVLNPDCPQISWESAAQIQWTNALNVYNPSTHTALFSYLHSHPTPHGPHSMTGFWRLVTASYRDNNFSVSRELVPNARGFPRKVFSTSQDLDNSSPDPVTPRTFSLLPNQPLFNLKQIWLDCHLAFVPPKWKSHCWKVLQSAYRTAERINIPFLCKYCNSSDTLIHRYFTCVAVIPIWENLNKCFPSNYLTKNQDINWFYQISSSEHDRDYCSIMFLIGLWSIHTAFLETMNSGNTYNKLPLLQLFSNISITFENILFGNNWPPNLKKKIQSWPKPWFLTINHRRKTVKFCPKSPPIFPLQDPFNPISLSADLLD